MSKRILVTGGAGFIGSHLCEVLLKEKNEVICLDNYFTGNKRNVEHLLDDKNFELVRHDVTLPFYAEVDEIYNLACPASPIHYQYNPIKTLTTSFNGTLNMLNLAFATKAKILQASTSEVYGDPKQNPQKESYWGNVNPIGPRACYDEGKRAAETLMVNFQHQHQVKGRIIRIFNTYGPQMNQDDGRVVSNFIVQALKNKPITIYGEGKQTRSFCFVSDTVKGMMLAMNLNDDFVGPINIGSTFEFTMIELAKMVKDMTGSKSEIIFQTLPIDDPLQRKPDLTLAKEKLNWSPQVQLIDGLKLTIAYFQKILN